MTDADDDLTPAQRRLIRAAVRKAHAKGERAGYARAMALVDTVGRLTGSPAAAVLKALPDAMLKGWDESKHPRDHGKFSSKPGGGNGGVKEGGEWDGAIAADEVDSANTGYSDKRLHPWTDEGGEGHEIWVEEGRYTPPGGEEVTVYRFVSFPTEGDDRDHEGEWVADRSEAREMGREYAEANHVEIGDPEDSDIPDDVDGVSWGNRDEIGRWADGSGNELTVRLDEATFRHGGQEYTCYRWTTWRDEDGEWTLDRDQAVADGEEYARSNHVEDDPDEDEDDEEPEYADTGGDRFDLDALPPPRKRDVALAGEKQSRSAAAFRVGPGVDEAEADHLITKVFGTGSPEEGRRALVASLGMPDDAVVRVTRTGDYEPLFLDDKPMRGAVGVRVSVDHPKMGRVSRFVGVDHQGRRFIRNEIIEIKPQHQGEGLGAEIFARQAEAAAAEGIEYICTHAAGSATEAMNGYYTWPRFGYDQRLDSPASKGPAFKAARERFPEAESILDVMATKEGRDWWKANGTDLHDARFDLDPGGRSMAILAAYQQERAEKKGRVVTKSTSPRSKTPPSKPSGQGSKLGHPPTRPAPAGDGDADPHHAAALALLDHAIEQAEAGEPAGDGLDAVLDLLDDPEALARLLSGDPDADPGAVAKAVGWLTVRKAWDESKHPRDHGKFASEAGSSDSGPEAAPGGSPSPRVGSPAPDLPDSARGVAAALAAGFIPTGLKDSDKANAKYHAKAYTRALSAMPAAAHARIAKHLKGVVLASAGPLADAIIEDHKETWAAKGDDHLARAAAAVREETAAAYSTRTGKLYMPQSVDFDDMKYRAAGKGYGMKSFSGLYAHELGHVIDGPDNEISSSPAWAAAFAAEVRAEEGGRPRLTSYAATKPSEGLAEFTRLLYASAVPRAEVEARFPLCCAVFKERGLWPS